MTCLALVCAMVIDVQEMPPMPPYGSGHCVVDPDRVEVVDDGIGKAVVTYYNSGFGCSTGMNEVITTPGGVSVRIVIDVNADADATKERITVIPQTEGMFAFPPVEEIKDGEEVEILVMGGMS
jgi:hypothetical protein